MGLADETCCKRMVDLRKQSVCGRGCWRFEADTRQRLAETAVDRCLRLVELIAKSLAGSSRLASEKMGDQ